jgi:hypothetical protein
VLVEIDSLVFSPFFRSGEIDVFLAFIVIHDSAGARARWMLWSEDVGPEVVDLSSFHDFVDGMRRFLVQDNTTTFSDRRATTTCASLLAASLFIDS